MGSGNDFLQESPFQRLLTVVAVMSDVMSMVPSQASFVKFHFHPKRKTEYGKITGIMLSYRQDLQISSMSNMLIFLACERQGVEGV